MGYSLGKEFLVVLEISAVYIILSLIVALIIDNIFNIHKISKPLNIDDKADVEEAKKKAKAKSKNGPISYKLKLFLVIFFQVIICVIAIFYLRKFVYSLPFIKRHLKHIMPNVYDGEIVISFIFIGTQYNLLDKLVQLAS